MTGHMPPPTRSQQRVAARVDPGRVDPVLIEPVRIEPVRIGATRSPHEQPRSDRSDRERPAPRRRPVAATAAAQGSVTSLLRRDLASPAAMRRAVVLRELLGPPVALRDARDRPPDGR